MSVTKRRWTSASVEVKEAFTVRYTVNGKRAVKQFDRKDAAKDFDAKVHMGVIVPGKSPTIKEAAAAWLAQVAIGRNGRAAAEPHTLRNYDQHCRDYIIPKLGMARLSDLSREHVKLFVADLLAGGMSRATTHKVLTSVKGILSEAMDSGKVSVNVAAKMVVKADRVAQAEKLTVPSRADVTKLLARADRNATDMDQPDALRVTKAWRRYSLFLALLATTGLRSSEARGLPWRNVKLAAGTIEITQRANEAGLIGPPKSAAGYRTIHIAPEMVARLRRWKAECPPSELGLVFPTSGGKPLSLTNVFNRAWTPIQIAAGTCRFYKGEEGEEVAEPLYRLHDLRHFHASVMIADGASALEVQKAMGHSSIKVTFDVYGSLLSDDTDVAKRADRAARLGSVLPAQPD